MSDAFNLAWKLAYVVQGLAGPRLLDSLTIERKPVGDAIVRRANTGMEAHRTLWSILGLTPETRQEAMRILELKDDKGKAARQHLNDALDATDAELQALGIQMNQIYTGSPATTVAEGDTAPSNKDINILKQVAVSTYPGYHLPHVWLAKDGRSPRISTLDLAGHGRFALFTGLGGECWLDAGKALSGQNGLPEIAAYSVGFHCDVLDCYRDWQRVRGVEEEGVVLVRPDHFVAWRYSTSSSDALSLLKDVLTSVLCLSAV
jgi:hypothetical protein